MDIRVAKDLFEQYLPVDVLSYLDLRTLKLSSTSFIGKKLQEFLSDVVYEVHINEQLGYLSIIIEHKSFPDKWLPLQLHHYQAQAMMQWHKPGIPGELAKFKLSLVSRSKRNILTIPSSFLARNMTYN